MEVGYLQKEIELEERIQRELRNIKSDLYADRIKIAIAISQKYKTELDKYSDDLIKRKEIEERKQEECQAKKDQLFELYTNIMLLKHIDNLKAIGRDISKINYNILRGAVIRYLK